LGKDGLAQAVERWRLTVPPRLAIPTEAADWSQEAISSIGKEAMGQGTLTISPLQMALVAATVANEGAMPDPQLTMRVQGADGTWEEPVTKGDSYPVLSPDEARMLLSAWDRYGGDPSASWREGVLGHWGVAVAGEGAPHAWFLGVALAGGDPQYAVAVLVEHAEEPERAVVIGSGLLEAALGQAE
jgi:peptidoglycan glycosyltransferase